MSPLSLPENCSIQIHSQLAEIDAAAWDVLNLAQSPFLSHAFLSGLEQHDCLGRNYGWHPCHLALYFDEQLIAALPLYQKTNNYGEFVFDQAWEKAWNQAGLNYYPKLVSAVPYTPALGQRFLIHPQSPIATADCQHYLLQTAQGLCQQYNLSGCHILFAEPSQQNWLNQQSEQLTRHDCQFHWFNQNYQTFDDFLEQLKGKKRKNIKQERRAVVDAGITFRWLDGHSATQQDWQDFAHFYHKTFVDKWSTPTLNQAFFEHLAQQIPDQIFLVLADDANQNCIAGALMFHSPTHLYGRHWGCIKEVKHLHFECCFYQGIEFAIQNGLQVFEPGAGGDHKIARGFVPVPTQSSHWLTHNPFPDGIAHFLADEKQMIIEYQAESLEHIPYKVCPTNPLENSA